MCGIAGLMTKSGAPPDETILGALQDALAHRGPDGTGRHIHGNVGLVQTRLAIIDLKTGDQPFVVHKDDGAPVALVANGEIYNYRELQGELAGAPLKTASDCEPPLHLYLQSGTEYAGRLRGMYAIAIHDTDIDRLVLSRDPFGIKPLYYTETDELFAFASEPQALIRAGVVAAEENAHSLHELLQMQFTCGRETVFRGIERVLPGETIVVRAGRIIERHRIAALPDAGPRATSDEDGLRRLDELLNGSVDIHQRSDVPYGMFLSGGIDSSVLIAMMKRLNAEPVRAFTAGFSGTGVPDERAHAKEVAKAAGAVHTEIEFGEADFWSTLPKAAAAMDDPAADYAVLPTYKLAQAAHGAGLKVVLSGEGGDELFGGYGRYRRAARPWLLAGRRMRASGILKGMGVLRTDDKAWRRAMSGVERSFSPRLSKLQKAQATDCADWLPNDLLTKLDRCLMAHGVEGRVPFIDREMTAFAFRLPDKLKARGRLGKWLLRKWLETALPASKPFTPKRGFTVPVGEWINGEGARLGPLVAAQPGVQKFCRPDVVQALYRASGKREAQAQWILLFFALWHGHYFHGLKTDGDVFAALAD